MADGEQHAAQQEEQQVDERVNNKFQRRPPQYARMCLKCAETTHTTRQCAFYKTHWCKHEQRGGCKLAWRCKYVHDISEMRPSTREWCCKFVFENGEGKLYGCRSFMHAYDACPQRVADATDATESFQRLPIADFAALVLKSPSE